MFLSDKPEFYPRDWTDDYELSILVVPPPPSAVLLQPPASSGGGSTDTVERRAARRCRRADRPDVRCSRRFTFDRSTDGRASDYPFDEQTGILDRPPPFAYDNARHACELVRQRRPT